MEINQINPKNNIYLNAYYVINQKVNDYLEYWISEVIKWYL